MKRLVELDSETMYAREIDMHRLKREANALYDFLLNTPFEGEMNFLKEKILPYCVGALNGTIRFPISPNDEPLNLSRILDEGMKLPEGFLSLYSAFFNTAIGSRVDVERPIKENGKLMAWMDFE